MTKKGVDMKKIFDENRFKKEKSEYLSKLDTDQQHDFVECAKCSQELTDKLLAFFVKSFKEVVSKNKLSKTPYNLLMLNSAVMSLFSAKILEFSLCAIFDELPFEKNRIEEEKKACKELILFSLVENLKDLLKVDLVQRYDDLKSIETIQ